MRRNISFALKNILKEKGMTQRELAAKSGIAETTIRSYAQGVRQPKEDQIKRLADTLGCDEIDLYQDEYNQFNRYSIGGTSVKVKFSEEVLSPEKVVNEISDESLANFFFDNITFGGKKVTRKKLRRIINILLED